MKQQWQRLAGKIDAMTLRERVIVFAMAALILITLVNTALLDPLYAKQKQGTQRVKQQQAQIAAMQAEIQHKVSRHGRDPDAETKARVKQLKEHLEQMQSSLRDTQKGLVSPDKMAALLEDVLRQQGTLRLVALRTLPPSDLAGQAEKGRTEQSPPGRSISTPTSEPGNVSANTADAKSQDGGMFRHGVELKIQGGYLDILNYLARLEAMQWQLFWSKASLTVEEHPTATLTLTLHTLSLDKKWLNM